jgi:hypothetical protein
MHATYPVHLNYLGLIIVIFCHSIWYHMKQLEIHQCADTNVISIYGYHICWYPSLRWLVLYLVVVRELVRLCDPESNICRDSSPWQV